MPIFEYKCKKCNNKFEKLVFNKEKIKCPECGSDSLQKLFSVFNSSVKSKNNNSRACENGTCNVCSACGD